MPQISGAYQYHVMLPIESEYLSYLPVQRFYVVTIPLLTETTEIIEILPDLRSCRIHDIGQILTRYPFHTLILKLPQIPVNVWYVYYKSPQKRTIILLNILYSL